ncbi:MAG: class I SAM-dependent methyltransferase [Candidatus Methanomethylophilaceae archaeon]|nr:class I SAM-dependent methyltransferase [Candidatus Methanomethylophilaceae archaeon]
MQTEMERRLIMRIPGYEELRSRISDLVFENDPNPHIWLDTGCGTGGLVRENLGRFPSTQFILADPSEENIAVAKEFMHGEQRCLYVQRRTDELNFGDSTLDAVTAILCHHYYRDIDEKRKAISNCYRMMRKGGIYVTVEHARHEDQETADREWLAHMRSQGLPDELAENMIARRDTEYFPLTEPAYVELLKGIGFAEVRVFWSTCSDLGIVAIK